MLDFERSLQQLSGLSILRFFPSDPDARLELAKLVSRMCSTEAQVEWLVNRTLAVCNDWPGPVGLRQVFCSKFKPADGISAGSTEVFPDGIPNEAGDMRCLAERELEERRRLEGVPLVKELPAGHVASADRDLDQAVKMVADQLDINRPRRLAPPRPREEQPANPNFTPITQADVDREVQKLRDKRAREELIQ